MTKDNIHRNSIDNQTAPVVLVDGTYHMFRSYHALPPLKTSYEEPTWAVLGCLNIIDKLIRRHRPNPLVIIFDAGGENFRNKLLPEYKKNRPPTPPELLAQFVWIKKIVAARGLAMICEPGVEADDVIASLARRLSAEGHETIISSNDKDLMQLVNPMVTVEDHRGKRFDSAGVQEKFSVPPDLIVDYLCLTGDQSDNIPGVSKVGPKTAAAWLQQHGSLQGIIDNADHIGGKIGENLRQAIPQLSLNRKLIQLQDDIPVPSLDSMRQSKGNTEQLRELYEKLEFRALAAKLPTPQPDLLANPTTDTQDGKAAPPAQQTIITADGIQELVGKLHASDLVAIYILGESVQAHNIQMIGLAVAARNGNNEEAAYIPVKQHGLDMQEVLRHLEPLLISDSIEKTTWNLKELFHITRANGCAEPKLCTDVMLQAYILNHRTPLNLVHLAAKLPPPLPREQQTLLGGSRGKHTMASLPLEELMTQANACALACLRLHSIYSKQLQSAGNERLNAVLRDLDLPMVPVLARMERAGVRIDGDKLKQQSAELAARLEEITTTAWEAADEKFNLDSPAQVREILFSRLNLPVLRKTPQGQPSTAESVLEELAAADNSPLPDIILQYRALSKLKSTYTDSLPANIDPHSGRIHTTYQQAGVVTGRLASSGPNLQNIPVRTAEGRKIRTAFIADPGYLLMAADYAQIELRIMAHLSGDTTLLEAFKNNRDVHAETAIGIFNLADGVTPNREQRRMAKIINFGLIYGMSAFSLGKRLKISFAEAEEYVDKYFSRYPGVRDFMDSCRKLAKEQSFVETLYGRKVPLPAINSRQANARHSAERAAINAPMQGTAADIIKRAMVDLDNWITATGSQVRMIMQVHDELIFEVPENLVDETSDAVLTRMVQAFPEIDLPLEVHVGYGSNWEQAH